MALPIVIVTSGGIAITESTNGIGLPVVVADNGFGMPARIVASGGLAVLGSASGSPVVVPAAPGLTWNSTSSDTTPDFLVDLPSGNVNPIQDAAAGDHLILEYQPQAGGAWTQYIDRTLSGGDITDDTISVTSVGAVSNGSYFFRGRIERPSPVLIGTNSSNASVTISAGTAPVNTVAPAISGNLKVGQTLTTTDGTWTGTATIAFTYQWKRGASNIASATASTYLLVEADAGQAITCVVTGTNGIGNSTGTSNSVTIDVYAVFLTSIVDGTDATTYSAGVWNTISLGTAAANRKIAVGVDSRAGAGTDATISSASIAAQTATSVAHTSVSGSQADFIIADVPTGTSGNISVTFSSARSRCGAGVWAIYGAGSSTPTDTDFSSAEDPGVTLTVPAKGVALACAYTATTGNTGTWTNATERYDAALESAAHSGADLSSSAGGNVAISLNWSAPTSLGAAAFASWGP